MDKGSIQGPGVDFLVQQGKESQFFLIGEDHGIAELPLVTGALFQRLWEFGYEHLAVETGPLTAAILEGSARKSKPEEAFAALNKAHPFSLPFFNWKQEAELLEKVVPSCPRPPALWGVDQEFILSPVLHFERLVELAPDRYTKTLAEEYQHQAATDYDRLVKTKDPTNIYLAKATDEDLERLEAAFRTKAGAAEAARISLELRQSARIYREFNSSEGYASNLHRSELMKAHFTRYYEHAAQDGRKPKVVLKFGATHVRKGRSYSNVYDLGNMVAELAAMSGSQSFHVFVIAVSGTQNHYLPFVGDEKQKTAPIDLAGTYSFLDVAPFEELAKNEGNVVVDLRPLRPGLSGGSVKVPGKGLADLIWGYDAVLILKDVHAATLFE
jgi:hypothetical protein